jgi:hypothetical protein
MEKGAMKKKDDFLLDDLGETGEEEEVIDLLDVVEEPEPKMSIDDFLAPAGKEEPLGEITPLESWEKLLEVGEKPSEEKTPEEEFMLSLEEKEPKKKPLPSEKGVTRDEELFEKIDFEEILKQVESIEPSAKKEWLSEEEAKVPEKAPEKSLEKAPEKAPSLIEEPTEKLFDLKEFEAALMTEVKPEPLAEAPQPFLRKEPTEKVPVEIPPIEIPAEEKELKELMEEELPEEMVEEVLGEEEITVIEEKMAGVEEEIVGIEEPKEQVMEMLEEVETPKVFKEEAPPPVEMPFKRMEEVITKGIQEMMEDFATKILPEMTQNIINLTLERIERMVQEMVRELVPDLAEKAIMEEIKRLQKGEKD